MENRNCQNCKKDFTIDIEDFNFYAKIKVPPPTWCPPCRMKRRMSFRNERKIFRHTDFLTGEKTMSLIPPESGHHVINDKAWWGRDSWDPMEYGMDFDESRPFFEQFFELLKKVPKPALSATRMINSDYSGNSEDFKNCYLCFNGSYNEDSAYANGINHCKNCYDVSHVYKCERCYNSLLINNCYETNFSVQCDDCVSVWFSKNCRGCTNCFGCVNLVNKSYCFYNEQLSKEEYHQKIEELGLDNWDSVMNELEKSKIHWLSFPNKFIQGIKNENVSGEYINNSKNVLNSFLVNGSKDAKYIQYAQLPSTQDSMDLTVTGGNIELSYENLTIGFGGTQMQFCFECWNGGRELQYCMYCSSLAANLFGCVGIAKQQYCILNKQYTKEEYFKLREKIIKHMDQMPYVDSRGRIYKYGEFFPSEFSPFAYNQTILPEHFSSTREDAEMLGMRWEEYNPTLYEITIKAQDLPNSIKDVSEEITKEVIECDNCKRAYRIILPEFNFLKQIGIPLPRTCIDCRHANRISQRHTTKIYSRKCMCNKKHPDHAGECDVKFETSYSPDGPEIVYCEKCYQQEVY